MGFRRLVNDIDRKDTSMFIMVPELNIRSNLIIQCSMF